MLALKTRVTAIEMALRTNTQITTTIGQDTSELLEMFRSLKGGFKVMGWLGSFAKWVAAIGTAIAALYALIQSARGH